MQSKGAIRFLAIALAVVCVYQLSFTVVTKYWENKAEKIAAGDAAMAKAYLDSLATVPVYNLLVKNFTFGECRDNEINLGLDLKGGMNVTMEVSLHDLIRSMSNFSKDGTFNKALAEASQMQATSQKDFVTLFGEAFVKVDANARLSAVFATKDLQDRINLSSSNEQVLSVIRQEADAAFDRTYQIIKTRIDKFGVTAPNVQKLAGNRILVELPGIKEPDRVRKLLQGTAKLEFWETYENKDMYPILASVDTMLGKLNKKDTLAVTDTTKTDTTTTAADTARKDTSDIAKLMGKLTADTDSTAEADTSAEKSFEEIAKENPLFAYLTPAYFQNEQGQTELRKGPVIGIAPVKDTGKVNKFLAMEKVRAKFPKEFKALWTVKPYDKEGKFIELVAIRMPARENTAPLEGDAITDARKQKGQFTDNWEIEMNMNAEGAKKWKRLTGENIGKCIVVVLDDNVYSYPVVQGEISGGRSQITGTFTIKEAEDLANILKVGKLPAPARIIEDTVVGPTLGQESIDSGFLSFVIALILILVFMVAYYNNAGWVADVALFVNVFYIMGVLASLGAALTLPGIAGIVLTIGMSVDANILIYERIREELRHGKGLRLAVDDGYKMAYSSIIDANVTTILMGVVLFILGSGPIQGFATTLIIGILTSMFSAIFISRLIFEARLAKNKVIKFSNKYTEGLFKNININFVVRRKKYYIFSSILILAGIVSFVTKGFDFGVDLVGGRNFMVSFDKSITTSTIADALKNPFGGQAPQVKTIGTGNTFSIITDYRITESGEGVDNEVTQKLEEGLSSIAGNKHEVLKSVTVGPTIADDLKAAAVFAVILSWIIIFIYILIRFKKWQFAAGATIALVHDVLVVMSVFSMLTGILPFTMEIDASFIAAILTVMGYSINDTVVVFDRVREFTGIHHTLDQKTVINNALNATLSRTINTSLTIFFVLLAIFLFGGDVIRGFIFAMLVGIVIGTYSSVCIATPVVIDLAKDKKVQL
ncbi:MAG TPA: protein translocase subunit SecDF [Bacteroidia bacterium]|nr:protein translocase subunit SecDF [Bacteroidia bacterium]